MADMLTLSTPIPVGDLSDLIDLVGPPPISAESEKAPPAPSKWEPQKLNPRHREIMRRLIEGASYKAIAEQMGVSAQAIMLIANSKLFKEEMEKLEAAADFQVTRRADILSNEALDTLKVIMRYGKSELARKSAADSILDRAGYGKVEKKLVGIINGEEVIKALNKQRRELHGSSATEPAGEGHPHRQRFVTEDVTDI